MVESAAQEIRDIHRLLTDPTPENFDQVTGKLETIAALLQPIAAMQTAAPGGNERAFLSGVPREMAAIRKLMEAPVKFYEGLQALRAANFGSYERGGTIKSLEPYGSSTTLVHL
ncbi:MAG: hypothetical protein JO061_02290 [Acidobacteriaceae bacterium]|nr:hypothetical protein [Acidobacteriaceae bacterium]